MTTTFTSLLDQIEYAIDDPTNQQWIRATLIMWAKEAMRVFPILRPNQDSYLFVGSTHTVELPADFREIVSVEYPKNQDPPVYLKRMNWLDQDFYSTEQNYDVDHDYADGTGWVLYLSRLMVADDTLNINYLATHETDLDDDSADLITVPDEYVNILIAYVIMKAYRERLSAYMQDPTAFTQVVAQMVEAVTRAEAHYTTLVTSAQAYLAASRPSPKRKVDAFDRVY